MLHASLFSGIGGFDLAAEWAGWENAFNCEIDPFCRKVLKYHFPKAEQYGNIKTTDFTVWRGRIDVLSGGFPCQPFSLAGKRQGTNDDRYLWPEMLRAIREIRPRWVVGENVFGIVNWSNGLVFEQVCSDLEAVGYKIQPFVLPACAVDAPHRRDRTWFIGHLADGSDARLESMPKRQELPDSNEATPHADCERWHQQFVAAIAGKAQKRINRGMYEEFRRTSFDEFPTQPPVCCGDDEFSARLDGITFPRWRMESVKAYGNAVVPELVRRIFDTINRYEQLNNTHHGNRSNETVVRD